MMWRELGAEGKNKRLLTTLENIALSGWQFHAYIFSLDEGGSSERKTRIANAFIKKMLIAESGDAYCKKVDAGNFEDMLIIKKDEKEASLTKSKIERMQDFLMRVPLAGEKRYVIVESADTLREDTQNFLLKTIEEPSPGSIIILLCDNHDRLLKTLHSRAMSFVFDAFDEPLYMRREEAASALIGIVLKGSPFFELNDYISQYINDKDEAIEIMECAEVIVADYLCGRRKSAFADREAVRRRLYRLIEELEAAKKSIRGSTKPAYALKKAVFSIHGF